MKKYNIFDLLDGTVEVENGDTKNKYKLDGIEIPIIQRDYAQGRESASGIRKRFLGSIFKSLNNSQELELDFIYGSIRNVRKDGKDKNVLFPLDGQQRLTTLYLISWFIANAELRDADNHDELRKYRQKLLNFSYSTRATARSFCEKLSTIGFKDNPSQEIRDSYWFHKVYEKDPTVIGMLNSLEDIQAEYNKSNRKLFSDLDKICFYILPLDGFDLTDELYIKMNARGKPLTDFENYKADLINWMKSDENPQKEVFSKKVVISDGTGPWYLSIASKFDNAWTDIFWTSIKDNKDEKKTVDSKFLNFLDRYFLNRFILKSDKGAQSIEKEKVFQMLYNDKSFGLIKYEDEKSKDYKKLVNAENIDLLENILDNIQKNQRVIKEAMKPLWDKEFSWFLYDDDITQLQHLVFTAVILYLENKDFEEQRFSEWMRVCWNIIIDPDIRSIPRMINEMKFLKHLSQGSSNILSFIKSDQFNEILEEATNIHKLQLTEEIVKAWLIEDEEWKEEIFKAEGHPLFQGNISFLLDELSQMDEISKKQLFIERLKIAMYLFDNKGAKNIFSSNHDLFRYCISKLQNWNEVNDFNYEDSYSNWQLLLRRNQLIKESIRNLCNNRIENLPGIINTSLESDSNIVGWDINLTRKIHETLYSQPKLFKWMYNSSANKIRNRYGYLYIIRPSAWYDKVMIQGFRNELVTYLNEDPDVDFSEFKLGDADFYWGENLKGKVIKENKVYYIKIDNFNRISIESREVNDEGIEINVEKWRNDKAINEISNNEEAENLANLILENLL